MVYDFKSSDTAVSIYDIFCIIYSYSGQYNSSLRHGRHSDPCP